MTSRLVIYSNRPRQACIAACGKAARPSWLEIVSDPAVIATHPAPLWDAAAGQWSGMMAILYGADAMNGALHGTGEDAVYVRRHAACPVARAVAALRVRCGDAGIHFGATEAHLDQLRAWRAHRGLPGEVPGFPPGFADRFRASGLQPPLLAATAQATTTGAGE